MRSGRLVILQDDVAPWIGVEGVDGVIRQVGPPLAPPFFESGEALSWMGSRYRQHRVRLRRDGDELILRCRTEHVELYAEPSIDIVEHASSDDGVTWRQLDVPREDPLARLGLGPVAGNTSQLERGEVARDRRLSIVVDERGDIYGCCDDSSGIAQRVGGSLERPFYRAATRRDHSAGLSHELELRRDGKELIVRVSTLRSGHASAETIIEYASRDDGRSWSALPAPRPYPLASLDYG